MDSENFAYWLQSFIELNDGVPPTVKQWKIIKSHLATVFHKVTAFPLDKDPDEGAPAKLFPNGYTLPPGHVSPEPKYSLDSHFI